MTEPEEIRKSLADSAKVVLMLLGNVADLEKRAATLKKDLNKTYNQIDDSLDKIKYQQ